MFSLGRLLARALLAVLVLVIAAVGITATRVVLTAREDDARTADAIVVLGAAQFDGEPQAYFTARLEHARDLYQDEVSPRVLTVGGRLEGDRFTEAEAGKEFLIDAGVPADAVLPIGDGSDTLQSMHAVAEVMGERGWDSAVVVTDPWHTLRAATMLSDQGVTTFVSPTRTGPSNDATAVKVRYVARETAALLYYYWQRWTGWTPWTGEG